jgi:hypothetical protein
MDVQKVADCANVGTFVLTALAVYRAIDGLSAHPLLSTTTLVVILPLAAPLNVAALIMNRRRKDNSPHKTIIFAYRSRR